MVEEKEDERRRWNKRMIEEENEKNLKENEDERRKR